MRFSNRLRSRSGSASASPSTSTDSEAGPVSTVSQLSATTSATATGSGSPTVSPSRASVRVCSTIDSIRSSASAAASRCDESSASSRASSTRPCATLSGFRRSCETMPAQGVEPIVLAFERRLAVLERRDILLEADPLRDGPVAGADRRDADPVPERRAFLPVVQQLDAFRLLGVDRLPEPGDRPLVGVFSCRNRQLTPTASSRS